MVFGSGTEVAVSHAHIRGKNKNTTNKKTRRGQASLGVLEKETLGDTCSPKRARDCCLTRDTTLNSMDCHISRCCQCSWILISRGFASARAIEFLYQSRHLPASGSLRPTCVASPRLLCLQTPQVACPSPPSNSHGFAPRSNLGVTRQLSSAHRLVQRAQSGRVSLPWGHHGPLRPKSAASASLFRLCNRPTSYAEEHGHMQHTWSRCTM